MGAVKQIIHDEESRRAVFSSKPYTSAGHPIGIIAIKLDYPKLPGNVVNASTYSFPVIFEEVAFEIEELFNGDDKLAGIVVDAAKRLEQRGAQAIVGACGYFAHFQKLVADAVDAPVYLSSLTQLPLIHIGLKTHQKILVVAADGASLTPELLAKINAEQVPISVLDVGDRPAFSPIRWGKDTLDNAALIDDLVDITTAAVRDDDAIGAILLECSDLPPYAFDISQATGLPVYDFITLINWVRQSVAQKPYYGSL